MLYKDTPLNSSSKLVLSAPGLWEKELHTELFHATRANRSIYGSDTFELIEISTYLLVIS